MFNGNVSLLSGVSIPKGQFRTVVLCGYGQDLYPLIEQARASQAEGLDDSDDEVGEADESSDDDIVASTSKVTTHDGQIKALLPVGGRKMIDWVIDRAEEAGLTEILVLAPASLAAPIESHLRSRKAAASTSSAPAKIDVEPVPEATTRKGLLQALQWGVKKELVTLDKSDVVLLPCDLMTAPTDEGASLSLASLLDRHRADDNLVTGLFFERAAGNTLPPKKGGPSAIATIYDPKDLTLLDVREMHTYEDDLTIRTSLLDKCAAPMVSTSLLPAHVYVLSSIALHTLTDPAHARRIRHTETLRAFVGWLARQAWRKKGANAIPPRHAKGLLDDELALGRSTTQPAPPPSVRTNTLDAAGSNSHTGTNTPRRPPLSTAASLSSAWPESRMASQLNLGVVARASAKSRAGAGGCKIVIWRAKHGFICRANTIAQYVDCTRAAVKIASPYPPPTNTPSGVFVSPDCFIHPSVYDNLGEKVGIKRSIIGQRCIVGKGSKLTNVIMMDGVVIGEGVKLDNCILSSGVQVRARSVLKDVEAGKDVIIDEDSNVKNDKLVVEDDE